MWLKYGAFPQGVDVFDALLMAFAAFRITRLVVYDKITRWFRELFTHKVEFERALLLLLLIGPILFLTTRKYFKQKRVKIFV
jgi:hypothetical protein